MRWGIAVVVLLAIAARGWYLSRQPAPNSEVPAPPQAPAQESAPRDAEQYKADQYKVARVVDGDTLLLASGARVRLIGADTPEIFERSGSGKRLARAEPWGPEASAFTKKFVAGGRVRLEFDGDRKDKHERLLAYVWVGDKMLNEELLRAGLAKHTPQYDYSPVMKRRFSKAQEDAQQNHRGRWSSE